MLETFKVYLDKSNFSKNTIDSYYFAVKTILSTIQ